KFWQKMAEQSNNNFALTAALNALAGVDQLAEMVKLQTEMFEEALQRMDNTEAVDQLRKQFYEKLRNIITSTSNFPEQPEPELPVPATETSAPELDDGSVSTVLSTAAVAAVSSLVIIGAAAASAAAATATEGLLLQSGDEEEEEGDNNEVEDDSFEKEEETVDDEEDEAENQSTELGGAVRFSDEEEEEEEEKKLEKNKLPQNNKTDFFWQKLGHFAAGAVDGACSGVAAAEGKAAAAPSTRPTQLLTFVCPVAPSTCSLARSLAILVASSQDFGNDHRYHLHHLVRLSPPPHPRHLSLSPPSTSTAAAAAHYHRQPEKMTITCLKLTLVRRAQDDLNASSLLLGQSNRSTINDLGRRQAVALAHALPPANTYSLVYSSDLDRARDTAAIVVAKSGGVIHRDARLRERHFGGRDGELYRAQFKAALFEYGKSTKNEGGLEHYAVPPNGESEVDVKRRLADFFEHRLLADLKELEDLSNSSNSPHLPPPKPPSSSSPTTTFDGVLKDAFEDGEEAITDVVVVRSGDTAHLGALI
ncbi:hypothetical protein TYRP_010487, partial [Tyrophagus putrescentiae]